MSNWKEKLKENQGGNSTYPQFTKKISRHLEIKKNPEGVVSFSWYDRDSGDNGEKKFSSAPIVGIIVGSAMQLSAFDANYGKNGRQITSSLFFAYKNNGVVYGSGENIFKGNMADAKAWMAKDGLHIKNNKVLFVVTRSGNLIQISTNMSMAIEDTNLLQSSFADNFIKLTPTTLDLTDETYTKKFYAGLNNIVKKNPPNYAKMTLDIEIDDNFGEAHVGVLDDFKEYKDFIDGGNSNDDDDNGEGEEANEEFKKSKGELGQEVFDTRGAFDDVPPPSEQDAPLPDELDAPF